MMRFVQCDAVRRRNVAEQYSPRLLHSKQNWLEKIVGEIVASRMFWILSGMTILARRGFIRFGRLQALAAVTVLGLAAGGCASTVASVPGVGLPANTPARPETPGEYLPVHDLPPPRQERVLDPQQQAKLEKDLAAARDRQNLGARAAQRKTAN